MDSYGVSLKYNSTFAVAITEDGNIRGR